jgi:AcrR family transcriptional regulator
MKQRNPYKGINNDRERTMQKLIEAVGMVIRQGGYTGLTAYKIAKTAGVNRSLIYHYFGTLDNLIETYVKGKDYFVEADRNAGQLIDKLKVGSTRDALASMLISQLEYFAKSDEWQKIILWQISERSKVMFDIAEQREALGEAFFKLADEEVKNQPVDLRPIAGLLVGGIYYMVLHAQTNDSLFCGIDMKTEEGLNRVKDAIKQILQNVYDHSHR